MPEELNPFASPQAMDSDRPAMAWADEDPEALRRVRLGLTMVYYGICALILFAITMPFLGFMLFAQIGGAPEAGLTTFGLVFGGLVLLLTLVIFAGEILCTAAPRESGAKSLAFAAVALQGVSLGSVLLTWLLEWMESPTAVMVVQGVGNLAGLMSLVCFVLFMRRLALFIQRRDVAGRATRSLIVGTVSLVLLVAGVALELVGLDAPLLAASIAMMVGGLGFLVALVMYANTVTYLRTAIMI